MIISRLELFNFRNYCYQDMEFTPNRNIITGRNAQGKSNLLEAVYFLSHLESKRSPKLRDLVKEGEKEASIRGLFLDTKAGIKLRVSFGGKGRCVEVNGRKLESATKAKGIVKCVMFDPDDLYMVKGDPSRRREFLEETAEETGRLELEAIQRYRHALRQRNAVLRLWEEKGSRLIAILEPWSSALAQWGSEVVRKRMEMVDWMEGVISEIYWEISGDNREVRFKYAGTVDCEVGSSVEEIAREIREALDRSADDEKRARCTLVGPHRDDVGIKVGGKEARFTASQGEQRTLAYCMRVAQKRFIEKETGETPVLLLDDVLSEMDRGRREKVLELAGVGSQSIITTVEEPGELASNDAKVFRVEGGKVRVV